LGFSQTNYLAKALEMQILYNLQLKLEAIEKKNINRSKNFKKLIILFNPLICGKKNKK